MFIFKVIHFNLSGCVVSSTRPCVEEVWRATEMAHSWCSGCHKVWPTNIGGLYQRAITVCHLMYNNLLM